MATNSTHTKVVQTNSRHGSGHKQYMCPSQSASRSGKRRLVFVVVAKNRRKNRKNNVRTTGACGARTILIPYYFYYYILKLYISSNHYLEQPGGEELALHGSHVYCLWPLLRIGIPVLYPDSVYDLRSAAGIVWT